MRIIVRPSFHVSHQRPDGSLHLTPWRRRDAPNQKKLRQKRGGTFRYIPSCRQQLVLPFSTLPSFSSLSLGIPQRRARTAPSAMVVDAPRGVETRARKRARNLDGQTSVVIPGLPLPGLPFDVVVTHVLSEEKLPDPADLALLRVVSRGMRDAVDATGRATVELDKVDVVYDGCLTTLRCLQRQGRLERKEHLCQAAARSGQIEEMKALHVENCPWDEETCAQAAYGGHLQVLQWARANGCPWNAETCYRAAKGGHLEVLHWARTAGSGI